MQKQYGAQSDKGMFCANSSQQSYIAGQHQQDAFISHEQLFRGPFINDVLVKHSFVADTVHQLALACFVSMGPIMRFRVNCSFIRRSGQYLQSKNNSVLRAPVGERVQRFCLPEVPSSSLALTYCFCIKKTALMAKYALFQLGLLWGFGLIAH